MAKPRRPRPPSRTTRAPAAAKPRRRATAADIAESLAESEKYARAAARKQAAAARKQEAAAAEAARQAKLAARRDRDRARRAAVKAAAEAKAKAAEARKAARKVKIAARKGKNAPPAAGKRRRGPAPPARRAPVLARLVDGCERILDVMRARRAPLPLFGVDWPTYIPRATLKIRKVEPGGGPTPWALVAEYTTPATAYPTLWATLVAIADDKRATGLIGEYTLARMKVEYQGRRGYKDHRPVTREWTIAEIAPYGVMLERAVEAVDPGEDQDPDEIDRESPIAARYSKRNPDEPEEGGGITWVRKVLLWLSSSAAEELPF